MSRLRPSRPTPGIFALGMAVGLAAACGDDRQSPESSPDADSSSSASAAETDGGGSGADAESSADSMTSTTGEHPTSRPIVYLHFDGGTFASGPEDARLDQPGSLAPPGPFEPAPDFVDRTGIAAAVTAALDPYGLDVTTTRPASGDYNMVVFVPSDGGFVTGIAIPDCGDHNHRNLGIVYVVGSVMLESSAALAVTGQAFGLELTDGAQDAMSYVDLGATTFADACVPTYSPSNCAHPMCPMGQQNSHAELLAAVAAAP